MLIEQTEIARKLGIPTTKFKKIVYNHNVKFELINNKRHYEYEEILRLIQAGRQ